MNKRFGFLAIAIAMPLLLAGCTSTHPQPLKTAVETPAPVVAANPISKTVTLVGQANLGANLSIKISQVGEGYPTDSQVAVWDSQTNPTTATATPTPTASNNKAPALDSSRRVVALKYEVTNTSSSVINMKSFDPRSAYYEGIKTISGDAGQVNDSDTSLHGLLGLASYPAVFDLSSSTWNLKPGETATWSMDWLVPSSLQDNSHVTLVQNFTVSQQESSIGNKFVLNLVQPKTTGSATSPSPTATPGS